MNQFDKQFIQYEYKELVVPDSRASLYLDCYENFGWIVDDKLPPANALHHATLRLKRNRKILNKMELTRLQRHMEACLREIDALERSKHSAATVWALVVGVIGTAFMAGSVFAIVHEPPIIWLCILLAVPAFIGWILPYFLFCRISRRQEEKARQLIENKYDEIYEICEKAHSLL